MKAGLVGSPSRQPAKAAATRVMRLITLGFAQVKVVIQQRQNPCSPFSRQSKYISEVGRPLWREPVISVARHFRAVERLQPASQHRRSDIRTNSTVSVYRDSQEM